MPKAGYTSYSDEKFHSTFATKLREELVPTADKVKNLADYLGVSIQAVNQYKQGLGFPKTENLVKIAQYFNCSLDYLIGLSDVKTPDANIQAIAEYTGLSQEAIEFFHQMETPYKEGIMPILEDTDLLIVAGYMLTAYLSLSQAVPNEKTIWTNDELPEISFNDGDGTISMNLSAKESAKYFLHEAQKSINTLMEKALAAEWNRKGGK